ncbi:hypothetical protein ACFWHT_10155 [Microbacterium sp. NPDC058342]|uniref:hypothetical protein n=1 Tax=Microbacterium sp. NPDC058342 TaxID=3346454 RepID=UPI0036668A09
MSTLAVTSALASVFVPIGIAGAVIALICALIVAFALARGAAGLAGGAVGVWIVGALLSWASSFADLWSPLLVSVGALGAALVIGAVLRVLVRGRGRAPQPVESRAETPLAPEPRAQESRTQPSRVTPTPVRPAPPVTEGVRAVA